MYLPRSIVHKKQVNHDSKDQSTQKVHKPRNDIVRCHHLIRNYSIWKELRTTHNLFVVSLVSAIMLVTRQCWFTLSFIRLFNTFRIAWTWSKQIYPGMKYLKVQREVVKAEAKTNLRLKDIHTHEELVNQIFPSSYFYKELDRI